ncbi:MAG: hypothetical protein KDC95_03900 [Planctomycetes bacterium]|nr:hypothetical protein [Planctomycetota bacterium]
MAQFALLLSLRLRLWRRQWQIGKVAAVAVALVLLGLGLTVYLVTSTLVALHAGLPEDSSARFLRLTSLVVSALFVIGPLVGLRAQEYLDVTKLFAFPVRPITVFTTTVLGGFLGLSTVFVVPLFVAPPIARDPSRVLRVVILTLVYMAMLHAIVQCVTLGFLNVLRSRRFRDLSAVLAPAFGLAAYTAMQALVISGRHGSAADVLGDLLASERLAILDRLRFALPPCLYADACTGATEFGHAMAVLAGSTLLLVFLGSSLTASAFHGRVALTREELQARTTKPVLMERWLRPDVGALFVKERYVQKRDPWLRMLLIQQLGFVALITIGEAWMGRSSLTAPSIPIWLLLYFEAGFLQNILGMEGAAFRSTALLPVSGATVLLGKNLLWLRSFALGNLVMVPSLCILGAWLGSRRIDAALIVMLTAASVLALPAILGTANLVSVLLPLRVPQRSRRALGQDQSHGGGCTTPILRIGSALLALTPAAGCAIALLRPWMRRPTVDVAWFAVWLPLALIVSLGTWWIGTKLAGTALDARRERLADYLR